MCAALLKEQGYNVIGMFMKNWEELDENGNCSATKDYEDVVRVCEKLDIPYYSVEFVKEYKDNVFKHFVEEYKAGFTPNPDILCNREIKFKVFLDKALELGADYLATGHYCQNKVIGGEHRLVKGADGNKDQTYFLYTIKKEKLEKVLFPIGDIEKKEVRKIAEKYDLATKAKKDSTGICFIGERNFKHFLGQFITFTAGDFKNLKGEKIGTHTGASYYTIGQRKGLGLGGPGEPWFVVGKDIDRNVVIVERGFYHPALYADELWADELSWISDQLSFDLPYRCKAKVRYRQQDQNCVIEKIEDGVAHVTFDSPQRAITLRQSIVFYSEMKGEQVCLGGGMISKCGPTYYELKKNLPESIIV